MSLWQEPAQQIARSHPEIWKRAYPRIYEEVGEYHSARFVAAYLAVEIGSGAAKKEIRPSMILAADLIQQRVPLYFLHADLITLLEQTIPPQEIDWANMRLPMEAGVFVFPTAPEEHGWPAFVAFSRHKTGPLFSPGFFPFHTFDEWTTSGPDSIILGTAHPSLQDNWQGTLMFTAEAHPSLTLKDLGWMDGIPEADPANNWATGRAKPDHVTLSRRMLHLLFSVLLVMLARPQLVEAGHFTKRRHPKNGREIWMPNILRAPFRIEYAKMIGPHGTHASPRMHFRRGFWRKLKHLEDPIWIHPTIVNAEDEPKEEQALTTTAAT